MIGFDWNPVRETKSPLYSVVIAAAAPIPTLIIHTPAAMSTSMNILHNIRRRVMLPPLLHDHRCYRYTKWRALHHNGRGLSCYLYSKMFCGFHSYLSDPSSLS